MGRPDVQEAVAEGRARDDAANTATRQEVLEVLTRVVRACPAALIAADGSIDLAKLRAMQQEIAEVSVIEAPDGCRRYRVRFRDVIAAIDRLAKLEGWDAPTRVDVNLPKLDYSPTSS